ncbi:MAG: hypothetical protein IPH31_07335 [Lewinellaceae bacterium]|nr:hypothetical protein [Lewinellaceae bacterium]
MLNMSLVSTLVFFLQISLPAPGEGRQQPIANLPITNHPSYAKASAGKQSTNPPITIHEAFDSILQNHVSDAGKVNYKGLKTDKSALEAYCKML